MIKPKTIWIALLWLLFLCAPVMSSTSQRSSPEEILERFLKLDYDGYGLSSKGAKEIFPLTTWIDGPGWDAMVVVKGYKIGKPIIKGDSILIPVKYDVLGISGGGVEWIPYKKKDRSGYFKNQVDVIYKFVRVKGEWKIHEPQIYPHVSLDMALRQHEKHLPGPPDQPEMQRDMKKVVDILRRLKSSN